MRTRMPWPASIFFVEVIGSLISKAILLPGWHLYNNLCRATVEVDQNVCFDPIESEIKKQEKPY